jgi:hypothetical protein
MKFEGALPLRVSGEASTKATVCIQSLYY